MRDDVQSPYLQNKSIAERTEIYIYAMHAATTIAATNTPTLSRLCCMFLFCPRNENNKIGTHAISFVIYIRIK